MMTRLAKGNSIIFHHSHVYIYCYINYKISHSVSQLEFYITYTIALGNIGGVDLNRPHYICPGRFNAGYALFHVSHERFLKLMQFPDSFKPTE